MRIWPVVATGLLAVVAACSDERPAPAPSAAADGAVALRRVADAEQKLVYCGFARSIHGEEGDGRATRMKVSRTSAGRTLLEWDAGSGPARRWESARRFAWLENPEILLRNYTVALDPADGPPVAWRETRHVTVRSAEPGRPSLDLLVDKETWLVLREEIRDFSGKLWLTNVFDTIDYRAPDALESEAPAETLLGAGRDGGQAASAPLQVTAAPAGFVRVGSQASPKGGVREDWTDGLAAFSIFERPADAETAPGREGRLERRACSGRSSVSGVFGGIEVSVVGNLPAEDLESVVRGLAPAK